MDGRKNAIGRTVTYISTGRCLILKRTYHRNLIEKVQRKDVKEEPPEH
jgi:hypothetical protein